MTATPLSPAAQRILAALPATISEIKIRAAASQSTAEMWINRLRKAGLVHVGGWRRIGPRPSPVFVAGPGKDAAPLQPGEPGMPDKPSALQPRRMVEPLPESRLVQDAIAATRLIPLSNVWSRA